jgi:hypothetical protein
MVSYRLDRLILTNSDEMIDCSVPALVLGSAIWIMGQAL